MGCGHCLSWLNLLDQPLLCLLMVDFNRGFGIESTPSRIHLFDQHFKALAMMMSTGAVGGWEDSRQVAVCVRVWRSLLSCSTHWTFSRGQLQVSV